MNVTATRKKTESVAAKTARPRPSRGGNILLTSRRAAAQRRHKKAGHGGAIDRLKRFVCDFGE